MQEIEDEDSTIGESQRLHALNDDDDDLRFGVQSLLKSSTSMDAVISLPSAVTDIAAFTANSWKELQMKENGEREVDGGHLDTLMGVSLKLLSKKYPSEIQWHGVKILLHLLRFWWNEISITECGNRVVGSKRTVATLVAEVAWRHGISELHDVIPHLVSLSAKGACEAELVCFILGSISKVGITCDALFEVGGRAEMFLHGLGEFLPQILPLLCSLLDKHARDYFSELSNQHMEVANQHECTIKAALDAAHAYAEWTPVTDLTKYGLIERCGSLLCSNIFRTQALQFFKSMLQSKRPVGLAVAEYDVTVSNVFPILISISEDPLKFIEPERRQCWKALYPSLGYNTVHAKALYKHLEALESIPAIREYPSRSHDGLLLTCSSLVHVSPGVDNISCPSDMEDIIEGYHLVEEHNMLSEAFICVASCPRVENNTELLSCILFPLSKIWNQPEWEISLMHYFGDNRFRTSVHSIAVFFEKELQKCMSQKSNGIGEMGKPSYPSLTTLLPLILPQLLKSVHSLWTDEVASDLSEEIEEAKFVMCSRDSSSLENEIRVWLQNIRKTGYMVIGSCSYLEGAFDNLLDSTFVCGALMKNLESMEFRHLTWFIKYTIIPLVKNCPSGLRPTWIDMLLKPVFHYCDYTLYSSWCHLLYKNTVQVPDNFGDISISKEEADKLGMDLIFKLTREVSNLLAAMALPKLNGGIAHEHTSTMHKATTSEDLESVFSTSLVGYLLYNDDLNHSILRFIAYIFGYWTDGVARITAVSFCHNLIRVASVMHSDKLISFVKDNIIPNVIRCLALEPGLDRDSESNHMRCDTDSGSDNKSVRSGSDILTDLCYDACRCTQDQGLVDEGTCDVSNAETFRKWLSNEVEAARCKNKSVDELEETSDELEEFPWIWEIEEEFIGYLPTYTGILHGLDVYVDNLKDDYFLRPTNLTSDFVSKHDVGSTYLWTVKSMMARKLSSAYWKRQDKLMQKFFCKLISFNKPYIKYSCYDENIQVQKLFEINSDEWFTLARYKRTSVLELFCSILELWEPQFHPLIREDHKDVLTRIASQLTFEEDMDSVQPFQADSVDFLEHLQPYAQNYINDMNTEFGYDKAKEQAKLHLEFDTELASGTLDKYVRRSSKGGFLKNTIDNDIIGDHFRNLDNDLRTKSLERRDKLLEEEDRLCLYVKHMKNIVGNEQLINRLQSLIDELDAEHFFLVDDDIEWGKKRFSDLIDKFEEDAFAGLHLPKCYVIRGIMDLQQMLCMKDRTLIDAFTAVVGGPSERWMESRHQFWMDTRYYEHDYYSVIKDPLKEIWMKKEGRRIQHGTGNE